MMQPERKLTMCHGGVAAKDHNGNSGHDPDMLELLDVQQKLTNLSNSNWPFLDVAAAEFIRERGVKHLLIDQPSVDKEEDGGHMFAHKAFWNIPENPRKDATITELIYIPDEIKDGLYLLNLQVAPIENDASPSRPVLFKLEG